MKTYTEIKGKEPFNWFEQLSSPEANDFRNYSFWKALYEKSASWVTCACGNQCNIIPRDVMGEPHDELLSDLGREFTLLIKFKDNKAALNILHKIEERSTQLIREIQLKG